MNHVVLETFKLYKYRMTTLHSCKPRYILAVLHLSRFSPLSHFGLKLISTLI